MSMILSEEQVLLQDSAREFIKDQSPVSLLRQLRDEKDDFGYSKELWSYMTEMGWAGINIPEKYDGLDFGFKGLGIIMEEAGRTLTASPLLSTVVLGANSIVLGGSDEQKSTILPKVASGDCILALAVDEGPHHDPENISVEAKKTDTGYLLNGTKQFVIDGHIADYFIVAARISDQAGSLTGLSLLLVDKETSGIHIDRLSMVDGRNSANVTFDNVSLGASALLGEEKNGGDLLYKVLDLGRIALAAEMLGTMQQAFDTILAYLKERKQFGKLIGSFQALQHRAAIMFSDIELCKSVVMAALTAVETNSDDLAQLASLAKATVNDAYHQISNEAIQMHGGIGMTDEFDIGFYLKRARIAEVTLGSSSYHRRRYANLNGY